MSAHAATLLQRLQAHRSTIELIYAPHARWPHPRRASLVPSKDLKISVLDSSFNPPTRAHIAMLKAPMPSSFGATAYDAKLLLLSVRNVDKSLKNGDATYLQRLELLELLAKELEDEGDDNVAVAIIDEPTFVGKSNVLSTFLTSLGTTPTLDFLLGFDTLERLFSPKYYTSGPSMSEALRDFFVSSRVVCARRVMSQPSGKEKETLEHADPWIKGNRIALIDIGEDEQTFSSSAVREARESGNSEGVKRLVSPAIEKYIFQSGLYTSQL